MRYKIINGWTKESMIAAIDTYVPRVGKCMDDSGDCLYLDDNGKSCPVGAFLRTFLPVDHEAFKREGGVINPVSGEPLFPEFMDKMPLDAAGLRRIQVEHDFTHGGINVQERLISWIKENTEE
jgi:hypothetical protein